MSIEEIQEIGKIVSTMTSEAREVFVWYLIMKVGTSSFGSLLLFVFGMYTMNSLFGVIVDHARIRYYRMIGAIGRSEVPVDEKEIQKICEFLHENRKRIQEL